MRNFYKDPVQEPDRGGSLRAMEDGVVVDGLETVEVATGEPPVASVIWLHGLGADGHDFASIVQELNLPVATRFVFPHAPVRAVTINQGARMRAWYDILSLERVDLEDEEGIYASAAAIDALIDAEVGRGIPTDKVVIAGFSQGGSIALHVALRYPSRLAGVLALSTYLPLATTLGAEKSPANASIPLFMAHGVHDPVVPEALGRSSRDCLRGLGYEVEWHSYPMEHSVCAQEVADISRWLHSQLV